MFNNTAQVKAVDIYGSDAAKFLGGGLDNQETTLNEASGSISTGLPNSPAFSWVAFVVLLVVIRVLYELLPEG